MAQDGETPQKYLYFPRRTLQTLALSTHEPQRPVGFFSLPAEIRNTIMKHILVVGDIQLQVMKTDRKSNELDLYPKVPSDVSNYRPKRGKPTNFQFSCLHFLATCKQACAEGFGIFFSENTFYLPWGPKENTHKVFDQIGPEYGASIRSVGLTLGLQDLTVAGFDVVEREIQGLGLYIRANTFDDRYWDVWSFHVVKHLLMIWVLKFSHLMQLTVGMRSAKIGNSREVLEIEGLPVELEHVMTIWYDTGVWLKKMSSLKVDALKYVTMDVEDVVRRGGSKALRNLVESGEF